MNEDNDDEIPVNDAPIPTWLRCSYWLLLVWGILWMFLYWNGTQGWLDRGYWGQLQKAAHTTFPEKG